MMIIFIDLIFIVMNLLFSNLNDSIKKQNKQSGLELIKIQNHQSLRDTLFCEQNVYLEVKLNSQTVVLYERNGEKKEYLCSTGNPYILKGKATTQGIFVIQYKSPKEYSKQFDSTTLLNWMGFNYGIGFHALLGNSYYIFLGKRASSHGCIRISKKDAKEIFDKISVGTPVFVRSKNSARALAFTDERNTFSVPDRKNILNESDYNLNLLYSGCYFLSNPSKIIIKKENITHNGLTIGDITKIPDKQHIPIFTISRTYIKIDKLYIKTRKISR